jgi:hypothetical protein
MDTQTDISSTSEPSKLSKWAEKFGSDGCSSSPDLNFRTCCEEHDYHYRSGDVARSEADARLRECIRGRGWLVTPWIYWLGVRLFGRSSYKGKSDETVE